MYSLIAYCHAKTLSPSCCSKIKCQLFVMIEVMWLLQVPTDWNALDFVFSQENGLIFNFRGLSSACIRILILFRMFLKILPRSRIARGQSDETSNTTVLLISAVRDYTDKWMLVV